jgi:predicted RNA binding protein YcfA (HicA-like mRNA interferase family)
MTQSRSVKARSVLNALYRLGWEIKRETGGSHKVLHRYGYLDFVFAFHDRDGILTVRFTYRKNKIRIIGAGYWRKGKEIYEKSH